MVGQRAFDLHAAIDRARVHHHRVRRGRCEPLFGQAVAGQKFAGRVAQILFQPLALDAKHHHHVGALDRFVDVLVPLKSVGQQRRRSGEPQLGAQPLEQLARSSARRGCA